MLHKVTRGTIFPRQDGKVIDEHFGVLNTQQDNFSLAHMLAPPGWHEPAQIADFDEVIIMLQGVLAIETEEQRIEVKQGETCLIDKGTRVTYSNAHQDAACAYWSLCMPAFRVERTSLNA